MSIRPSAPTRQARATARDASTAWLNHRKVCFTCTASLSGLNPAGACPAGWELWVAETRARSAAARSRVADEAAAAAQVTLF